jgi:thiamine kinase-like enzyme
MELAQVEALARRVPQLAAAKQIDISFLAGGITNQNYRLVAAGEAFVLRVSGANTGLLGIDRVREAHNHCIAASAGIAPDAVAFLAPEGYLVTRFIRGEKISPAEMRTPGRIQGICRSLHAVHDGPRFRGTFSPFRAVERYLSIARARNAWLPENIARLEEMENEIERALYERQPLRIQPIHADLLNENLIDDARVIRILDWEYSGMGDIFFDLGNFADHHRFGDYEESALLREYFGEYRARDGARLKLMRIMSDFREAMWGVVQETISTLDYDFRGYAKEFFERLLHQAKDERYPHWLRVCAGLE